jgi:hypothetical protein
MAKPILIVRIPLDFKPSLIDSINEYVSRKCPDYNVLVIESRIKDTEISIITEHNQPQGLSV